MWSLGGVNDVPTTGKVHRFNVRVIAAVHLALDPLQDCADQIREIPEFVNAWKVNDGADSAFSIADDDRNVIDKRRNCMLRLVFVGNCHVPVVEESLVQCLMPSWHAVRLKSG